MITVENDVGMRLIICDKCHIAEEFVEEKQYDLVKKGWRVNTRAKKYIHLCEFCTKTNN